MAGFKLQAPFSPAGDQPRAIEELVEGLNQGQQHQVLLGVTGSGKTFTMANVIAQFNRPTLVLAHNKTLAAQLYEELKLFFPDNAVEYFVSYYDYYQPEAYIPSTDTFIEKDSLINDAIDRMRLSATRSLLERDDVIVVASVSCIYGIGSAEAFYGMLAFVEEGQQLARDSLLRKLVSIQYKRNDYDFHRGTFRVRGDTVDIFPAYEELEAVRISFFGDEVDRIDIIDPVRGERLRRIPKIAIYPGTLYVLPPERKKAATDSIADELKAHLPVLRDEAKFIEAVRLEERTRNDLELLETIGVCPGIENYSRHFTGRAPGEPPPCLLDYFKPPWLMIIDESHTTLPQVGAMYRGDRSRKTTLVEHGFRLPSALDNRPLKFEEFEALLSHVIHASATPGDRELERASGVVVEQLIRPTGLLDPWIEVRPATTQVDDVIGQLRHHVDELGDRALVTVLSKRMAEDLTDYLREVGFQVRYLHSDIDTLERVALLRGLREGEFDVLVGINLLREGLDLPEVSLVAILDADKEGFLRDHRSLIQTSGRAARNLNGRVIFYADRITRSMKIAIDETLRRRRIQEEWNETHGITPRSVSRAIGTMGEEDVAAPMMTPQADLPLDAVELKRAIETARESMKEAAKTLNYEEAAQHRDRLIELEKHALKLGLD